MDNAIIFKEQGFIVENYEKIKFRFAQNITNVLRQNPAILQEESESSQQILPSQTTNDTLTHQSNHQKLQRGKQHSYRISRKTNLLTILKNNEPLEKNYESYIRTNLLEKFKQNKAKKLFHMNNSLPDQNYNNSGFSFSGSSKITDRQPNTSTGNLKQNNSLDCSVLQTSKLQKSIDNDGKTKINEYTVIQSLGQGAFGKVKLVEKNFEEQYAIKIANKKKLKRKLLNLKINAYSLLEREIAIMKKVFEQIKVKLQVNHPNIVRLYEVIDDPDEDKLYMVMEFMQRGSVLSKTFLSNCREEGNMILDGLNEEGKINSIIKLPLDQCQNYFRQFIQGLDYLHNCVGVIHRDIKPDNLLISKDNILKIADFGVSHIIESETITSQQGTLAFLAPEVLSSCLNFFFDIIGRQFEAKPIDIWASGVTLYQMVCGKLPFQSRDPTVLKKQIQDSCPDYSFLSDNNLIDLLSRLMEKDPKKRITIEEIMIHPWITDNGMFPMEKTKQELFEVTEEDMSQAITKLNVGMALKTASRMVALAKKSKFQIRKICQQ